MIQFLLPEIEQTDTGIVHVRTCMSHVHTPSHCLLDTHDILKWRWIERCGSVCVYNYVHYVVSCQL